MYKFAIVVSQFNKNICDQLLAAAIARLHEANIDDENIFIMHVPGAIEIPLAVQLLAQTKKYSAIISLGCVIRGETNHYDYVCEQVSFGCQRVMLDHNIPVIFGILTTENLIQAEDRSGGAEGNKGMDAAETALQMVEIINALKHTQKIQI